MANNPPPYNGKVEIEYFPSRNEIISLIDNFLIEKGHHKDYKLINQDNHIIFTFKNSDIAYEVAIRVKTEQIHNPIYHLIRVSLSIAPNTNHYVKLKAATRLKSLMNRNTKTSSAFEDIRQRKVNGQLRLSKQDSSLLHSCPYLSAIDLKNVDRKKNKTKWINNRGFNPFIGVSTSNKNIGYHNYVTRTPSDPPSNYQFKVVNKRKWISNSTFK